MPARLNRRDFMKTAAAAAGATAGARLLNLPYLMGAPAPTGDNAKLRLAVIGCGGRGTDAHVPEAARQNLVALVDADDKRIGAAIKKAKQEPGFDETKVKTYNDYRKFFDEMNKEVDAVLIATPNHHHAPVAMHAIAHGIAVYVEKPMAYNVWESRTMTQMAHDHKVPTQMGNQGHSGEGYRRLCEYIWAGAIGNVTEVYHWTNRANGGVGPRPAPIPVPAGFNWDSWLGPAPFVDYHPDTAIVGKDGKMQYHSMHPHEWHGWFDYGNGSLGNMACHVMDGAVWALNLEKPTMIEVEDILGGSTERYPVGTRIRWDYPARGAMPPVKVWWYDGRRKGAKATGTADGGTADSVATEATNRPPIMEEWEKKLGRKYTTDSCTFYVGDKGIMYTETYGGGVTMLPYEQMKATPVPPEKIARVKGGHHGDFFRSVKGGPLASSNFEVASKLTEVMLLGDLAIIATANHGLGTKIEWDGDKCTNLPDVNNWLKRVPRTGWETPTT